MLHASPMQGPVVRTVPYRLPFGLLVSVSSRLSWSRIAWCADGSSQCPSTPGQSLIQERDSSVRPFSNLPPLPSRNERFLSERTNDCSSNYERFRSIGSRSVPSLPSIPGRFSKYSKPLSKLHKESAQHKALRRDRKAFRKPMGDIAAQPDLNVPFNESSSASGTEALPKSSVPLSNVIPEWMQQYQHSYSETPKTPIIGFRQTPWSPFGPEEMVKRPWTGSAPLKPSKKNLPEFDSFNPPPSGKKGVKYVQKPGPFPPGIGPKPSKTREEILGEPLTPLEITELVDAVNKRPKQINLGRDGLTHNMLDVVHTHWKRSVCCKIKCKGVPTVDLENVARVIEERTGGVIIHRAGGVMYVFRGRNYNYKDRPKIPIMLWKPPAPIYPKLIQSIPDGLTEEETRSLRAKGRRVAPLCKLAKNGVYMNLVANVRAQLKIDEVVRVDCEGLNPSDYRKIGAKLKELVPCILLSFEKEQIIICRVKPAEVEKVKPVLDRDQILVENAQSIQGDNMSVKNVGQVSEGDKILGENVQPTPAEDQMLGKNVQLILDRDWMPFEKVQRILEGDQMPVEKNQTIPEGDQISQKFDLIVEGDQKAADVSMDLGNETSSTVLLSRERAIENDIESEQNLVLADIIPITDGTVGDSDFSRIDEVDRLWQRAIDEGKALQLDNEVADLDVVFEKTAELSEVLEASKSEEPLLANGNSKEGTKEQDKISVQLSSTSPFDVPPIGTLGVDDLAKLLAP